MTQNLDMQALIQLGRTCHQFQFPCTTHVQRRAVKEMQTCDGARPYLHRTVLLQLHRVTMTLLEMSAPHWKTDDAGETALHTAARIGHVPSVQSLVRHGAGVNAQNTHRWTPLLLAARYGHITIVEELVAAGADVDARGFHGWTALHLAHRYGNTRLCELLLAAGADADAVDDDGCCVNQRKRCWGVI